MLHTNTVISRFHSPNGDAGFTFSTVHTISWTNSAYTWI